MQTKMIGYIVRSKTNPTMILCTNGEWHWDGIVGPGGQYSAKLYKTQKGAGRVRGGEVIVEAQWV